MITLFLDSSTSKLIVSLFSENTCLFFEEFDSSNNLSSMVLPIINKAFQVTNLSLDNLNKIIVVNGPGSFTGIRVGVTVAKTIAWAKNIAISTVSSLEVISTTEVETKYIVPLIDARRDCFYACMYDEYGNIVIPEQYISRIDLFNKIKRHAPLKDVTFVSYDEISDLETLKPNLQISKIIEKYYNSSSVNAHSINPNYLKKVEAEEKLNDKRN